MQITLSGVGLELTDPFRTYVDERIGSLTHIIGSDTASTSAVVEVGRIHRHRHGNVFFAKVNIHLGGNILRAEAQAGDPRSAINEVEEELHNEILKFKGKKEAL